MNQTYVAFCKYCYKEHQLQAKPIKIFDECTNCKKFNGLVYHPITQKQYIALCKYCKKEHKRHEKQQNPFDECTACHKFNGLVFS